MVGLYAENVIMKPKRNHIDYNKKNSNPNNLITLCSRCHSKTNFFNKKWIKYFKENNSFFIRNYIL